MSIHVKHDLLSHMACMLTPNLSFLVQKKIFSLHFSVLHSVLLAGFKTQIRIQSIAPNYSIKPSSRHGLETLSYHVLLLMIGKLYLQVRVVVDHINHTPYISENRHINDSMSNFQINRRCFSKIMQSNTESDVGPDKV
jgi:hypothetical protein